MSPKFCKVSFWIPATLSSCWMDRGTCHVTQFVSFPPGCGPCHVPRTQCQVYQSSVIRTDAGWTGTLKALSGRSWREAREYSDKLGGSAFLLWGWGTQGLAHASKQPTADRHSDTYWSFFNWLKYKKRHNHNYIQLVRSHKWIHTQETIPDQEPDHSLWSSAPSKGQAAKRRPETASKAQSQRKPALTHELEATHGSAASSSPAEAEVSREHAQPSGSGSGSASRPPPSGLPGSPRGGSWRWAGRYGVLRCSGLPDAPAEGAAALQARAPPPRVVVYPQVGRGDRELGGRRLRSLVGRGCSRTWDHSDGSPPLNLDTVAALSASWSSGDDCVGVEPASSAEGCMKRISTKYLGLSLSGVQR